MERSKALQIVKQQLTSKRYEHTLGVMESALNLAQKYRVDTKKAELAAIFHDYAKFRPVEEMKAIIIDQKMPEMLLDFHSELWHAPVGAYLVKTEVGITDEEVLQAIRYHTTGNKQMNTLDKIIFLADYIEPGRSFPGVEAVRNIAEQSLNAAVVTALKNTIKFLLDKSELIYPDTLETYNSLIKVEKGGITFND
ncbi:bis(5'-nucleosyl)-tetraphosphatase (symmetrical) YqeK [Calidifontibacillus oryziterrae]|uniref:bis(5'-nucleosyl)-tetraphosphatase (symmetrical) YqeK n=1 Tax=Calidifontibacillus oryziterrae TaxID=1191699 RepID=UPI0002F2ABA4|nr:bis(5'-nucleosyl)-tetraphosphatase (symmetrical) YqeK [Calidifontibacillus oryziterrae]